MKATRVPSPITLEMNQQEAEMFAFLLHNVKTHCKGTQNMMDQMLNTLENVGVVANKGCSIRNWGGDFYITYDVMPM